MQKLAWTHFCKYATVVLKCLNDEIRNMFDNTNLNCLFLKIICVNFERFDTFWVCVCWFENILWLRRSGAGIIVYMVNTKSKHSSSSLSNREALPKEQPHEWSRQMLKFWKLKCWFKENRNFEVGEIDEMFYGILKK